MATLVKVDEVKELLNVKEGKAYQIMKRLNKELEEKGFITIQGRVPIDYLKERFNLCDEDVN
ncbi:sugar-specific transcriptional regulator TrmB [Peptoniphilus koenoeneniae]|uniref:Sugar-specific transcriptional regulator TrmB n=1 Tax=Peptoniphilus koenoeneniae TaxID=507751 RepID=A0ABU0AVL8_9FIRM|nr:MULTISPECIES: hypothetical protein [Peptoniphilus]ERT56232.1 ICEBs1 excisionase domain protein [Peptoniphilus sp. BV3C26]MDQ0275305.1 sugar-specific transcriptional regulator TrmB [Peptoniphilus koenoeneniae]